MPYRYLLHQSIHIHAEKSPHHPAVRFLGQELSYSELFIAVNQLANRLIELGVQRGDRVGIYMNKNLYSAVAIYGILAAGAAYVPLDPFAPVNRLAFVINDCNIKIVITQSSKRDNVIEIIQQTHLKALIGLQPDSLLPVRAISWEEVQQLPNSLPAITLTEHDLAYILYTSGSTGTPKGIMHTHRSGLSFAEWAVEVYGLQPEDRISNHAPLHFDLSTFDFFASAIAGAATVIVPEAVTKLPASMAKLIQDERISVWYSVPFALIQMMERGNLTSRDYSNLRWILFAGEPFPTKHLRNLMNLLPRIRFSNLYGPTETNVCTFYHVPPLSEESDEPIPIGIVCANTEDLVVDSEGNPLPNGEIGELLIRGGTVMKGYWGRPDLTERGFFRRRMFGYCEDIFYRTGDLVQKMSDGNFKFFGRKDRQIKTRGYRVELDEVESALLSHPSVHEAAAYPVPDVEGSNLIEAAVIPAEKSTLRQDDLIEHLSGRLPTYAMPVKIIIAADFPRTSTGKINRRELQERSASSQAQK
ncbi:MAG: amino acid adenylation domain-containing protein [Bellilinea sp.]|jgi:amino acid adenylation domain-containing protein